MKYTLYTQLPQPKLVGGGDVDVSNGKVMFFPEADKPIREMVRVRLEYMSASGIRLSGMEKIRPKKSGDAEYAYQEWQLNYPED